MKGLLLIKILRYLLCSLVSFSLYAKIELDAQYTLSGIYLNDSQVQARLLSNTILFDLDYNLLNELSLHANAGGVYETGSNSSIIIDEFQPQSQLIFRHGYLKWIPYDSLKFEAGALGTNHYHSPLLITSGPYLGVSESFNLKFQNLEFYLKLIQAVPNNNDLSRRVGFVSEGTPKYFMETVGLKYQNDSSYFLLEASTFRFDSLGTVVAYNSQFLGNSVSGGAQANSKFLYDFSGYNLMSKFQLMFSEMYGISFQGHFLANQKAPDSRNIGYHSLAGLILGDLTLFGGLFENQSDSSPAFYNSGRYAHNNQQGFEIGFESIFPSDGFRFRGFYLNSSPIRSNIYQSNRETYILSFVKDFNLLSK